ncbi:MAG: DUF58 domain-containing protein [Acidobacteriota bacterium]
MKILSSPSRDREQSPLVNLSEITEVELLILKRMREFTIGEHRSLFHGTGFDFVGLRDWAPGDRFSSIDWPQSSLTNFSPLIVREFEQPSTANVMVVADGSLSTRCGVDGVPIAAAIARAIATIGMSAVFFQDMFGLMMFETDFDHLAAIRPRIGKNQVIHCLDAYQYHRGLQDVKHGESLSRAIAGFMRKTSLIPIISDFLFDRPEEVLRELAHLNSSHDVFLILIDAAFAFEVPKISAGWVEAFDVETGSSRVMSRGALRAMAARVRQWQDDVERSAKDAGLDVLKLGLDQMQSVVAITEFVMERRLRKTT